jgi:hypothetical protein
LTAFAGTANRDSFAQRIHNVAEPRQWLRWQSVPAAGLQNQTIEHPQDICVPSLDYLNALSLGVSDSSLDAVPMKTAK